MKLADAIAFLNEVKKTQMTLVKCVDEVMIKMNQGVFSGDVFKKWSDLLSDFNRHASSVENATNRVNYEEYSILDDVVWFRSLARKLDYFDVDQLDNGSNLTSSIDSLFISSVQ